MSSKYLLFSTLFMLAFVALTGCASSDKFKVMERRGQNATRPVRVMVRDFVDERPRDEKTYINFAKVPLNFYGGYFFYDRHDAKFPTQVSPFPSLVAQRVAERLNAAGVFSKVEYVAPDATPALGDYDVELKGTIHMLRTRGRTHYYGLSIFGDFIHYLAVPKFVRRWEIDMDYKLVDAYTGETLGASERVKYMTRRSSFSVYANRGKIADLDKNMVPAIDEYVDAVWTKQPAADASEWADLKARGAQLVASGHAMAQAAVESRKPAFRFISPSDGDQLRGSTASLRWDATAPGKLKTILLVANNEQVGLGINPLDLATATTAPSSIQPREVTVPLKLGENRLEALVEDHIGDQSRAAITITRLPQLLTPARRYAFLYGEGGKGFESLPPLESALADPRVGQFPGANVSSGVGTNSSTAQIETMLKDFGSRPVAGDLVLIHLASSGTWQSGGILGGRITLKEFIDIASRSIATENVLVILDIDWDSPAGDQDLLAQFGIELKSGWALLAGQSTGGPAAKANGQFLLAPTVADVLRGVGSDAPRLTVERFLNDVIINYEPKTGGQSVPESFGRYNRNNTMAERQ